MKEAPNEAVRLLHMSRTGPRALARAAGVSSSTAAAWHAGRKRPGSEEAKTAIERKLQIPREAWTKRPGFFVNQGQLELWLISHPVCRAIDHNADPCPICSAYETNPTPAPRGEVSLAEIAAVADGRAVRTPGPTQ